MMKKNLIFTFCLLLLLTISTAIFSNFNEMSGVIVGAILLFSIIKFLLVAFQFMDLKKANSFWKTGLILVLGLIVLTIFILKKDS